MNKDQAAAQPVARRGFFDDEDVELEARAARPVATALKGYELVRAAPLVANAAVTWKSWAAPVGAFVAAGTGLGLGAEAVIKVRDFQVSELAVDALGLENSMIWAFGIWRAF
ncbi:hypothetical protein D9611_009119 [Ephemerocybe angulata]|uniref:Uncharacterized protein n=1 Tax=Ephemerocybe angulata TaxID=980116 RepID=A0A8H5CEF4_9AGAR|nr:hypothetical protein D9611_009119 [Tulosesus angulatus]